MISLSSLRVAFIVGIYWITSWAAVFVNKFVYSHMNTTFSAPFFITLIEFVSPTIALYVSSAINSRRKWIRSFPTIEFSLATAKRVFPLSLLFCLTVTMSNLCLKYVEVSFYQISRSLGIPMIPLINYILFGEKSTWQTVLSCITVVVGYIAGVEGEINFSLRGTLFGLGASLVGTFYTIYLHQYLTNIVTDSWVLSFYNNLNSSLIMCLITLVTGEESVLRSHRAELTPSFFMWTFIAGLIGLFVGLTTQLQIKMTSSLSHNISGVMKNCIQTFMGAAIYRTPMTFKGVCGVLLVVGGSCSYALERIRINSTLEKTESERTKLITKDVEKSELLEASVVDE